MSQLCTDAFLRQIIKKRPSPHIDDDVKIYKSQIEQLGDAWRLDFSGSFFADSGVHQHKFGRSTRPLEATVSHAPAGADRLQLQRYLTKANDYERTIVCMDEVFLLDYGQQSLKDAHVSSYMCTACKTTLPANLSKAAQLCKFCKLTLFCTQCSGRQRPDLPCCYCIDALVLKRVPRELCLDTRPGQEQVLKYRTMPVGKVSGRLGVVFCRIVRQRKPQRWKRIAFDGSK